jgi:hypothetical protein
MDKRNKLLNGLFEKIKNKYNKPIKEVYNYIYLLKNELPYLYENKNISSIYKSIVELIKNKYKIFIFEVEKMGYISC